ncbi:hypothetical protein CRG98_037533, partial [Punica granatum]
IRFATVDLQLHTTYVPGGAESIYNVDRRVCEKTQVLPPLPEDRFLCGFSHIFAGGYAAGYYSYKVFVQFRGREPSPEPLLRHNGLLPAAA